MNTATHDFDYSSIVPSEDFTRGVQVIQYVTGVAFHIASIALACSLASGWVAFLLYFVLSILGALLAMMASMAIVYALSVERIESIGEVTGKAWGKVTGLFNRKA
jgi:hypothetical protein